MTRARVLGRGQVAAAGGMADTCTVRRRTGSVTDPDTGVSVPAYTTLYSGACKVQNARAEAARTDVGGDYLLLLRLEVHLPLSVVGLQVGDQILITAAAHDADLTGRVFRIHDLAHKTFPTARRVGVIEITGS